MSEIGFDPASVGVMAAAYAAVVPIIEIPSGILADRWSRHDDLGQPDADARDRRLGPQRHVGRARLVDRARKYSRHSAPSRRRDVDGPLRSGLGRRCAVLDCVPAVRPRLRHHQQADRCAYRELDDRCCNRGRRHPAHRHGPKTSRTRGRAAGGGFGRTLQRSGPRMESPGQRRPRQRPHLRQVRRTGYRLPGWCPRSDHRTSPG